jgi:hypothetical protein
LIYRLIRRMVGGPSITGDFRPYFASPGGGRI